MAKALLKYGKFTAMLDIGSRQSPEIAIMAPVGDLGFFSQPKAVDAVIKAKKLIFRYDKVEVLADGIAIYVYSFTREE